MNNCDKIIIAKHGGKIVAIKTVNDKMQHIFAFDDTEGFPVGTIVNARITGNISNIEASFLQFSEKDKGFINKLIKSESVIPVVFIKEASGNKKPLFSDKLYIEGDYSVVQSGSFGIKVSSKIPEVKAKEIKKIFIDSLNGSDYEIIVRTKACTANDGIQKALEEAKKNIAFLSELSQKSPHRPPYAILYKPKSDFLKTILSLAGDEFCEIVTDEQEIYDLLDSELKLLTESDYKTDRVNLRLYEDNLLPLCKLYGFDAKISEVLSRKICLKSGGYVTFDTTEALTAIDVNTAGSSLIKSDKEDMFLKINIEAFNEIFRQIRLRNISGNILIDFINMKNSESYEALSDEIKRLLKDDDVKTDFYGFTGLKLAEISRQKRRNSFYTCYKG